MALRPYWSDTKANLTRLYADLVSTPQGKAARAERDLLREQLRESGARRCYVRFGDPPPRGVSWNYARGGGPEGGLSVWRAYRTKAGNFLIDPGEDLDAALTALLFLETRVGTDKPVYCVKGRVIGTGSAGEPLLGNRVTLTPISHEEVFSVWEFPASFVSRVRFQTNLRGLGL
jgi:hypothetical protein